ncbi:MAG: FMN-binding protein [Erysipelotrichaceae bacterium]|nr:FMN-binding protein [Erysipelotrichaceae bacterium]
MKSIMKLGIVLALVAAISGGMLSYVYNLTNPIIEAANLQRREEQLTSIYDGGEEFVEITDYIDQFSTITNCFKVVKDNTVEGYVYQMSVNGYGGKVTYLVALDESGIYKGYETIDVTTETSGFGSRVATDEMKAKVIGKDIGSKLDALTGATITSSAVIRGIDDAVAHYQMLKGGKSS